VPNRRTHLENSYVWRTATSGEQPHRGQSCGGQPHLENSHWRTATGEQPLENSHWRTATKEQPTAHLENSYVWKTVTSGEQERHI